MSKKNSIILITVVLLCCIAVVTTVILTQRKDMQPVDETLASSEPTSPPIEESTSTPEPTVEPTEPPVVDDGRPLEFKEDTRTPEEILSSTAMEPPKTIENPADWNGWSWSGPLSETADYSFTENQLVYYNEVLGNPYLTEDDVTFFNRIATTIYNQFQIDFENCAIVDSSAFPAVVRGTTDTYMNYNGYTYFFFTKDDTVYAYIKEGNP